MGCVCTRKSRKRKDNYNFEVFENNGNEGKKNDSFKIKTYLIQIITTISSEFIKQKKFFFEGSINERSEKTINKPKGLQKTEGHPFMNATLQCLSNIDKLTNYILNKFQNGKDDDTKKISYKYYDLLHHLWDENSEKNSYTPKSFNILIDDVKSSNTIDFLKILLEKLHKELNKAPKEENNIINNNIIQYNEEEVRQYFFKEFYQKNRSVISDLFYLVFETKSQCSKCNSTKNNFYVNTFLDFPLKQICHFYKEKIILSTEDNGSYLDINLYECFDYYKNFRIMDRNKQICNICNGYYNSNYSVNLYSLTKILVINLDRGKNEVYQCKVNFPEELDLTNYVTSKKSNTKYELFGVICHIGPNSISGQIMAFCRNRKDNKWYLYNDSFVTLCENPSQYLNANAFILFYKSKSENNIQNNKNVNNNIYNKINNNMNNINNNNIIINIKNNNFPYNNFYYNNFFNNNFYNNNFYNKNCYNNLNSNINIEQNFGRINKNNNTNIINDYNLINQKESFGNYNNNDEEKSELHQFISNKGENIISIEFLSFDQNIRYSISCKKTDSFSKIEQELYKEFPEYKEKNNIFLVNGEKIDVNKTLEDNNIEDRNVILFGILY